MCIFYFVIESTFFTLLLKVGNILSDVFNVFNCTLHCLSDTRPAIHFKFNRFGTT